MANLNSFKKGSRKPFNLDFEWDIRGVIQSLFNAPLRGVAYHFVNSYTIVQANNLIRLNKLLNNDILICDGKPLFLFLKYQNQTVQQIRGADFMRDVIRQSPPEIKHFFLGSTDLVLDSLITNLKKINVELNVSGSIAPEYKLDFYDSLPLWTQSILAAKATVVWVGLGTPKQDFVVHELAKRAAVHFIAVGAAFDFLAGNVRESPRIFQVMGLEWLFRLMLEPRRLFKRYLFGNFKFLYILIVEMFFRRHSRF